MKPFRFRAAALLDLQQRQCDAARAEFARLTEVARAAGHLVEIALEHRALAEATYFSSVSAGSHVDEIVRHRNWIATLRLNVENAHLSLETRSKEAAQAAEVVRERFMRVRILERLRDRLKGRHETETRRQEMKEIDLLAVLQHGRTNHQDRRDHRDD